MRLVCLECSAVYEAPDNLFGPQPREVRCNRCGYQWTVIGARPEESASPAALPVGPAETPAPEIVPPPAAPPPAAPMPAVPVAARMPVSGPSRLADSLAGPLPPAPDSTQDSTQDSALDPAIEPPPLAEPATASTRTLLASGPADTPVLAAPDPEERRLSHELDFGDADRRRPARTGGARRAALLLVVLIVIVIIAAVLFKPQVIAALPQAKAAYTAVGL
jgi:predicted Zn finger-like uncharacterized protein